MVFLPPDEEGRAGVTFKDLSDILNLWQCQNLYLEMAVKTREQK